MSDRLVKAQWTVRPVAIDVARRIVTRFHYARGAANTAVYTHGLFRADAFWDEECAGVAWWIPPTRSAAEATHPANWQGVLSLSRLVVAPDAPPNSCSFLIGRSVKMIDPARWPCLVTYADEWQGHTGAIYRATNWAYAGLTKPERTFVKAGRMLSRKAGATTRTTSQMEKLGATCAGSFSRHKYVLLRGAAA